MAFETTLLSVGARRTASSNNSLASLRLSSLFKYWAAKLSKSLYFLIH